jgi:hypothetical protein
MSKILPYFGSEQSKLELAACTGSMEFDLLSERIRGRLSSDVDEDGKNEDNPFRGDPKRPGIR